MIFVSLTIFYMKLININYSKIFTFLCNRISETVNIIVNTLIYVRKYLEYFENTP